jgi:hypothetical protein
VQTDEVSEMDARLIRAPPKFPSQIYLLPIPHSFSTAHHGIQYSIKQLQANCL